MEKIISCSNGGELQLKMVGTRGVSIVAKGDPLLSFKQIGQIRGYLASAREELERRYAEKWKAEQSRYERAVQKNPLNRILIDDGTVDGVRQMIQPYLGIKVGNILEDAKIKTFAQLVSKRPSQLLNLHGFGEKHLADIRAFLAARGLSLKES